MEDLLSDTLKRCGVGVSPDGNRFTCSSPGQLMLKLRSSPPSLEELGPILADRAALNASLLPFAASSGSAGALSSPGFASGAGGGSLIKALMRIEESQEELLGALVERLNELATEDSLMGNDGATGMDLAADVPRLLLREVRWLEHIEDPKALTDKLLEVIEAGSCPIELQREILGYVPEIVADDFEVEVAEKLYELMSSSDDLLVPALDALTQLALPPELQDTVATDIMSRLESTEPANTPVLVRFVLQTAPPDAIAARRLVRDLRRSLKLSPITGFGADDDRISQESRDRASGSEEDSAAALTLDALRNGLRLRPDVANAYLKDLGEARGPQQHHGVDLWYIFCMHPTPAYRGKVEKMLRRKAESGCLDEPHLVDAMKGRGAALAGLFPTISALAGELLRGGGGGGVRGRSARRFGTSLYLLLFLEFCDGFHRQEVVAALVGHVGSGNSIEADAALEVFDELLAAPRGGGQVTAPGGGGFFEDSVGSLGIGRHFTLPPRRLRVMALRPFAVFLKGMLDFVGNMSERNVRRLFRSFFILGDETIDTEEPSEAEARVKPTSLLGPGGGLVRATPIDDVHIVIRKFLALSSAQTRRHGIIGAVAFLAQRGAARQERVTPGTRSGGSSLHANSNDDDSATMLDRDFPPDASPASQGLGEWRTKPLGEAATREVRDTVRLAIEACSRDPALLGFLIEELARAVEARSGPGLHPALVHDVSERFMAYFQVSAQFIQ